MPKHDFDYVKINLASSSRIREWGSKVLPNGKVIGKVTKPDTINYRTFKPEVDGLFCEKIFGPVKSWQCYCGKYKGFEPPTLFVCEQCEVEVTESRVRRHRMGYIQLAVPVTHVWYLKGVPSYLSILLKIKVKDLEELIYFNNYLVFTEKKVEKKAIRGMRFEEMLLDYANDENFDFDLESMPELNINNIDEIENFDSTSQSDNPQERLGAEAIKYLLDSLDLNVEIKKNRLRLNLQDAKAKVFDEDLRSNKSENREKMIRRIRLLESLKATQCEPSRMILDVLPVIPPGLRPMVQLDGGRFATSDLNELYRRVIIRNNRLLRLLKIYAPSMIILNEKRMLQEAVDALIDNGRRGKKMLSTNNRPLKSLSDIIEGKHGRFRQNLLGKRVDYSGRSVIIVGPSLKLQQCGLPHEIAFELFQPFIMHHLINRGLAGNIKIARRLIQSGNPTIRTILEGILATHPILLNRAPTLHRLGIQAFQPILIEGRAIKLHPLVCPAFNADFDGDQMAVHIPLCPEALEEAYNLMLAPNNFLSPASGEPIVLPSQDMVLGAYYLTALNYSSSEFLNHYFCNSNDVILAYQQGKVGLHTPVWLKTSRDLASSLQKFHLVDDSNVNYINTTPGRVLLNNIIFKNLSINDE